MRIYFSTQINGGTILAFYIEGANLMALKDGDFFEVVNGRWYARKVIKEGKHYIQMDKDDFREVNEDSKKTLNIVILEKHEQPKWINF